MGGMGDTAAASDLQWMMNEFGFGEILRQQENATETETSPSRSLIKLKKNIAILKAKNFQNSS